MDPTRRARPRTPTRGRLLRWGLAACVFIATLGAVVASYLGWFGIASCRDQVAGNGAVVHVCQPIGTADVVVIGLVLGLAAMLIWPDLSELGIPGLISLKRRVEATEEQGARNATDVRNLTLAEPVPDVSKAAAEASATLQGFTAQAYIVRPDPTSRGLSEERADAERELVRLAAVVERYLSIGRATEPILALRQVAADGLIPDGDVYEQLRLIGRWQLAVDTQLQAWAAVRNQAIHFPERLSDDQVRDGVQLSNTLVQSLRKFLEASAFSSSLP